MSARIRRSPPMPGTSCSFCLLLFFKQGRVRPHTSKPGPHVAGSQSVSFPTRLLSTTWNDTVEHRCSSPSVVLFFESITEPPSGENHSVWSASRSEFQHPEWRPFVQSRKV